MPKGNPFGYAAKKMRRRATKGGANKDEKNVKVKRMKPTQKNKYYG